ncbi:MAG: MMPL family transporter [Myxococcales bacterium]|nr:MMPL family transporter [Myxococcales bacterium]
MRVDPPRVRVFAFCHGSTVEARTGMAQRVEAFRGEVAAIGGAVRAAGHPLLNLEMDHASRDIERTSLPLLVGVCVGLLLLSTRSVRLTIAALLPVGLGVLATEGLLTLVGRSTDIIVNIAKPLLFVVLLASALHIVVAFQDARRDGRSPGEAAEEAAREKGRACLFALCTTALGFASLAFSDMRPVRTFGLLTAAGLTLGVPLVLAVLPMVLRFIGGPARVEGGQLLGRVAAALVGHGLNQRWRYPALAAALIAGGAVALWALPVSPGGVHYFGPDMRVRAEHEAIAASGLGLSSVEMVLTAPSPEVMPEALDAIDAFARAAEALPGARKAMGAPLLLREATSRVTGTDGLPPIAERAAALADPALRGFVSGGSLRLSLLIDHLDAKALDRLHAALRARFEQTLGRRGFALELTGHHALLVGAQAALVDTLLWSLLSTALLIELLVVLALRSVRRALAVALPTLVPVFLNFILMWLLGVPLDLGTSMTGAIAIGIAVDDALHFTIAWGRESPLQTARGTGRALVMTSVVICAGFLSLLPAPFTPTAHFGLLCAAAMVSALAADLLVLPPLLARLAPR